MSKPINFAVPIPAAGENAIVTFEFADLERLESELGVGYVNKIFDGLRNDDTKIIRKVMTIAVKGGDPEQALAKMPINAIGNAIADALTRRISGETL